MSKKLFYYGSTASFLNDYSIHFDGVNEACTVADNSVFSFGNGVTDSPFSLSLWVKAPIGVGSFMAKNTSPNIEWDIQYNGNTIAFVLQGQNAPLIYLIRYNSVAVAYGAGWNHICCTYSGSSLVSGLKIYFNSVRIDNTSLTLGAYVAMKNTAANVTIGYSSGAGYAEARMYHPAIISKELTQAEVNEIYAIEGGNLALASFSANVVAAYKFPNGSADYPTWTDYIGSRNGTLGNGELADITTDVP